MSLPVTSPQGATPTSQAPPPASPPGTATNNIRTKRLTPDQYARAVLEFSKLRTGVGQNHEQLAEFLQMSPHLLYTPISFNPSPDEAFVTLYDLGSTKPTFGKSQVYHQEHGKGTTFRTCSEFADTKPPEPNDCQSQILFLSGYPSPQWLAAIGSKYHVDPEFFARHMDFRSASDKSNNFSFPALPSASWHLIELPITTIGFQDAGKSHCGQDEIDLMRKSEEDAMKIYRQQLSEGTVLKAGNAIVRQHSRLDETHFAIEQRISICVKELGTSWVRKLRHVSIQKTYDLLSHDGAVLVWLDSGSELRDSIPGPWSSGLTRLIPIMNYRPMDGLKSHLMASKLPPGLRDGHLRTPPQSGALLHVEYGRSLRPNLMACDALYALNELFSASAFSERQFLNLIESKLDRYQERDDTADFDNLPNLKYFKRILYRHKKQIQQSIDSMRDTDHRKWPKATGELREKAFIAREALSRDFHCNLDLAKMLLTRCNEDTTTLMSSTSIGESKKAIILQERLGKLTFLAFIFVPLSFTTSFFSMTFKELGSNTDSSIWAWFLLSVPMVVITLLLYLFDILNAWKRVYSKIAKLFFG